MSVLHNKAMLIEHWIRLVMSPAELGAAATSVHTTRVIEKPCCAGWHRRCQFCNAEQKTHPRLEAVQYPLLLSSRRGPLMWLTLFWQRQFKKKSARAETGRILLVITRTIKFEVIRTYIRRSINRDLRIWVNVACPDSRGNSILSSSFGIFQK